MIENFAIFILSHQRARSLKTLDTLAKCSYTGDVYIIVDDMDSQLSEYKEIYGDKAVVFSKKEIKKKTDSCDNFDNLATPLYARNFCFDFAKSKNLDYFIMADDDITDLKYAYVDKEGKFKRPSISDFDGVVKSLKSFMETNNKIVCCGFLNGGGYFGGKNGKFKEGLGRNTQQIMMFKTNTTARFLSTKNEDLNISISDFDKLFFEVFSLCVCSPKRGTNTGGINYNSMYENNAYTLMIAPSAVKILENGKMSKINDNIYPKILSGSYKK